MKNLKPAHRILPIIFFIFLFCINIFSQVEIKERVETNPGTGTMNPLISGCTFGNCSYYDCDSSEIYIRFTPASVEPGESTIMKLWIVDSLYEYNEENYDIIQKTITIEPECGQLTYFGGGEYLFTAPDTLTVDSFVVTINYENYNQFCAGWDAKAERTIIKDNYDCIDCPIPLLSILWRHYASRQLTIKWDSLDVSIEPSEISAGDTAKVIIKKRLPGGTLVDFDLTQTYEIAKLEGCVLGNILVNSDSGAYFYNVSQPIYFVVADSLEGDSTGTVLLRVGLLENDKLKDEVITQDIDSYGCFTGNFNSESFNDKKFQVGPTIELISYANGEPKKWINGNDPAMPEFPIQIEITNDTRGNFDFLRYYLFLEWKNTQQTGDPVYGGGVTKLVHLPSGGSPVTIDFDIDWDYPNPGFICGGDELTLRIEYKGVNKNFKLNTDVLGDNPDKQIIKDYIANSEFPEIDLPLSEIVTEADQILQMQIIVLKESTWKQFKSTGDRIGYPNVNPKPHDWGLCQLSKPDPTIKEIWNWKENINSGIHFLWGTGYDEKYYQVKKEFNSLKKLFTKDGKVPRNPNRKEFLIMLSQRYKRGFCYDIYKYGNLKGEKGYYDRSEDVPYKDYEYGDDFWKKFEDVEDGPPYTYAKDW
jgi:hypothetical protein